MIEKQTYNFGFIFALENEAEPIINFLLKSKYYQKKILSTHKTKLLCFKPCKFSKLLNKPINKIYIYVSNVGKTNASIAANTLISKYKVNYLINIGVVGVLDNKIKLLTPIIIQNAIYHDVDLTMFGYKYGQLPGLPQYYNLDKLLINSLVKKMKSQKINFNLENIATGDKFLIKKDFSKISKLNLSIKVIDMELASIMQTSYQNQIPVISIKFGSDYINSNSNQNIYADIMKNYSKKILKVINLLFLN